MSQEPGRNDFVFRRTARFRKSFLKLPRKQRESCFEKFRTFKSNPWHPSLGTHPIRVLSEKAGEPVYSVVIENDLRVLFVRRGNVITSLDVGNHSVYR